MSTDLTHIRNFCIIAHIDHGKSTLADRLLELTGTIDNRNKASQIMDKMELEQERGITIKAQSARLMYKAKNGQKYQFNLIDTPGHVDFSYEVSRSLKACEGALLLVDASQGVQAQTLAHTYEAISQNLELILVWNKIDLPNADIARVGQEVEDVIGLDASEAISISAKTGDNVDAILERIVTAIPAPKGDAAKPLKALLYDSWYDQYLGVVCLIRVFDGQIKKGMKIEFMSTGHSFEVERVGVLNPFATVVDSLSSGEVGFFAASIKEVAEANVGDTITEFKNRTAEPLAGFRFVKPTVFCGIFPTGETDISDLRDALEKLKLNDTSISFEPENSVALGFGFRCGFLGLLHMEIIQERLEREFEVEIITTAPTVAYKVHTTDGQTIDVDNPAKLPDPQQIDFVEEPIVEITIHTPQEFLGNILKLCEEKRGQQLSMEYMSPTRLMVKYDLPLNEMVFDFYDKLKSSSKGYASLDYEFKRFERAHIIRLDMLINGDKVDALSVMLHKDNAYYRGRELAKKLKSLIPRQMFEIAIQAAIGSKIIARETQSALRKNVTAKCYGGDISRKRKLLEKQKEGKKRMKRLGNVELPQDAFLAILKVDE
ncbi:MAG: translation elongation factor 4 [Bdellovibrionales bacterium]|nr:translation elongation factor 4 [Bdellovibrionales bacterium]